MGREARNHIQPFGKVVDRDFGASSISKPGSNDRSLVYPLYPTSSPPLSSYTANPTSNNGNFFAYQHQVAGAYHGDIPNLTLNFEGLSPYAEPEGQLLLLSVISNNGRGMNGGSAGSNCTLNSLVGILVYTLLPRNESRPFLCSLALMYHAARCRACPPPTMPETQSQYAPAAHVPLIKSPSLRVPKPVELPPDIHPLPESVTAYFVYPFTLEPHILTLESARRAKLASHNARREQYIRAREDDKERRRRDALRQIAPGFEPQSGTLVPTRTVESPHMPEGSGSGQPQQPRDAMDEMVAQLARLDAESQS